MATFGLFNMFKRKPDRKPSDQPAAPNGRATTATKTLVEYDNVVSATMAMAHPITYRALMKIAQSVQTVKWYAEKDPDVVTAEQANEGDIKRLNALLKSPNETLSADQLKFWLALNYAAYGRVPFKVGVSAVGSAANGVYPLSTAHVRKVLDGRGLIDSYLYGPEPNAERLPVRSRARPLEAYAHEIFIPSMDGLSDGATITALRAIGLPTAVIRLLLQRAVDTASGHPNNKYIIATKNTLTNKQKKAIKEQVEEAQPGGDESGNVLFLYNTEIDVKPLDNNLSDIHSKMPMDDMTRMIFSAFGIPIAMAGIGAADGAKFAGNYSESRLSFWEDTIIPNYLTPIAEGMTAALCPPGARVVFDYDSIPAIAAVRIAKAKDLEQVSFFTDDEKRELAGFEKLTDAQRTEINERRAPTPVASNTKPTEEPT